MTNSQLQSGFYSERLMELNRRRVEFIQRIVETKITKIFYKVLLFLRFLKPHAIHYDYVPP